MIALGSDHAGFALKQEITEYLKERGLEYKDYGTFDEESCDYPVFGMKTAQAVASGECEKGLLFCGTGVGISIAANKVRGIRAAVCSDCFSAEMTRRHNDANILALGGRVVGAGLARKIVQVFLDTEFEGGRHTRRVGQIMDIEVL